VLRGHEDSAQRLAHLRQRLRRESGLLMMAFAALAAVLPLAIGLWLGQPAGAGVTTAFCLWGAGCGVANLHSLILNGGNRPLLTAAALVPGTALAALLAWWLAPAYGSTGVAGGFAAGAVLSALLMIGLARRLMAEPQPQPT
jgi:O-antigen/teichoic acid export membrane protein